MRKLRPRVLLADDHPMMLEGLKRLLNPNFEIVGAVTDGFALLDAAVTQRPGLIVADISMAGIDGIQATHRLRYLVPEARVLILSCHTGPSWVNAAFDAGACGYLTKISAPGEIETAVREVLNGNLYISPLVSHAVLGLSRKKIAGRTGTARPAAAGALTPREIEIVRLVGRGLGNREIAGELGLSVATVRTHLNKVYEKIGLVSRVELAIYAVQSGEAVM